MMKKQRKPLSSNNANPEHISIGTGKSRQCGDVEAGK